MAENSKIEWTDHTFNPWIGCSKVSPACDNCYAERFGNRFGIEWGADKPRKRTSAEYWKQPLRWNKEAEKTGVRPRVFCASLADVFDNAVPPEWRTELFGLIEATPNLDWLLLNKRIGNVLKMVREGKFFPSHWPNVWLGATICNQEEADRDIPKLLAVPAAKRFLSIEPMLGAINLERPRPGSDIDQGSGKMICQPWLIQSGIDWVIVGGGRLPMHPAWVRDLRDQCVAANVPFFFKQWGEWGVDKSGSVIKAHRWPILSAEPHGGVWSYRVGKKAAGRLLDGREWNEVPA